MIPYNIFIYFIFHLVFEQKSIIKGADNDRSYKGSARNNSKLNKARIAKFMYTIFEDSKI